MHVWFKVETDCPEEEWGINWKERKEKWEHLGGNSFSVQSILVPKKSLYSRVQYIVNICYIYLLQNKKITFKIFICFIIKLSENWWLYKIILSKTSEMTEGINMLSGEINHCMVVVMKNA